MEAHAELKNYTVQHKLNHLNEKEVGFKVLLGYGQTIVPSGLQNSRYTTAKTRWSRLNQY